MWTLRGAQHDISTVSHCISALLSNGMLVVDALFLWRGQVQAVRGTLKDVAPGTTWGVRLISSFVIRVHGICIKSNRAKISDEYCNLFRDCRIVVYEQ
jgi:hypothetical protein